MTGGNSGLEKRLSMERVARFPRDVASGLAELSECLHDAPGHMV